MKSCREIRNAATVVGRTWTRYTRLMLNGYAAKGISDDTIWAMQKSAEAIVVVLGNEGLNQQKPNLLEKKMILVSYIPSETIWRLLRYAKDTDCVRYRRLGCRRCVGR